MKSKSPWVFPIVAGLLAINLTFAEESQDVVMKQTIDHLEQELQELQEYQDVQLLTEIHKTEGKMKSDLQVVTYRHFNEEMLIDVHIYQESNHAFKGKLMVMTDLNPQFYPELEDLILTTISMNEVDVAILAKQ